MGKARDYIPGLGRQFLITSEDLDIEEIKAKLGNGAVVTPVDAYTKTESDAKYPLKAASYTKTESDTKFAPVATTYTKVEADGKYALKTGVVNATTAVRGLVLQGTATAPSVATDVAGLLADYNALLVKLKTAGILA